MCKGSIKSGGGRVYRLNYINCEGKQGSERAVYVTSKVKGVNR